MKFCPECGEDLKGSVKFCPECGINLNNLCNSNIVQEQVESEYTETVPDNEAVTIQKTTRELGTILEESVEKIYQERGYQTKRAQKIRGQSGQFNEIDVLATRGSITLAIECKNYEDRIVGVKEIRDFVSKLNDLDIKKGLFVTYSDFSSDAMGWANNNPSSKELELWDRSIFVEEYMKVTVGRTNSNISTIENSLEPKRTLEDYSILTLKNKDKVIIKRRELVFHPYYIVEFNLHERFKTPDRQVHIQQNSGKYFVDGLSRKPLCKIDNSGNATFDLSAMQKQIVIDLGELTPSTVKILQEKGSKIMRLDPLEKKDIDFNVKARIVRDNKKRVPYSVRISRDKTTVRIFQHSPSLNAIQTRLRLVYVPIMKIEFESMRHTYSRLVLPASDVTITDDIADCRHKLGLQKRHTFAVCEVCGVAKCDKDILVDEKDQCYCKDHASAELKENNKGASFTDKIMNGFRFGK